MVEQYEAWYKDPRTGAMIKVYVQADNPVAAKSLLEGQYGAANVWGVGRV